MPEPAEGPPPALVERFYVQPNRLAISSSFASKITIRASVKYVHCEFLTRQRFNHFPFSLEALCSGTRTQNCATHCTIVPPRWGLAPRTACVIALPVAGGNPVRVEGRGELARPPHPLCVRAWIAHFGSRERCMTLAVVYVDWAPAEDLLVVASARGPRKNSRSYRPGASQDCGSDR